MSGAITAAECGISSAVFEKSDKVGGVTAYSSGLLWVAGNHLEKRLGLHDSWRSGHAYLMQISAGFANDHAARAFSIAAPRAVRLFEKVGLRWQVPRGLPDYYYEVVPDGLAEGRYLEVAPFDANVLGKWRDRTRTSPYSQFRSTNEDRFRLKSAPPGESRAGIQVGGTSPSPDIRCMGPGLAASLVKAALDRAIPLYCNAEAKDLIVDGSSVVGVRVAIEGRMFSVRARRGVLIAMSGYDWNRDFVTQFDHRLNWGSRSPSSVTGDHLRLAGSIGARIVQVPNYTTLGFAIPGELDIEHQQFWRRIEVGKPHAILVNRKGRRFADESFYLAITKALAIVDSSTQSRLNDPCWAVLDSTHVSRYGIGGLSATSNLPEAVVATAGTLGELARKLEIDPSGLESEVRKFNAYAKLGHDRDFLRGANPWSRIAAGDPEYRPNPNLAPISRPPFYGVRMSQVLIGIPSAGLLGDDHARVMNYGNDPIHGLYVAGNSMALIEIGNGYQSGFANSRGMTYGYLAAKHASHKVGARSHRSMGNTKTARRVNPRDSIGVVRRLSHAKE